MYIVQVRWIDYYVKCECVCELFSLNQSNVRVNFPLHSSLIYNAYKMMFAVDRSGDDGDETDKLWCDIWMCHNIFYTVITTINYKASKTFHVLFGWEINSIINIWKKLNENRKKDWMMRNILMKLFEDRAGLTERNHMNQEQSVCETFLN